MVRTSLLRSPCHDDLIRATALHGFTSCLPASFGAPARLKLQNVLFKLLWESWLESGLCYTLGPCSLQHDTRRPQSIWRPQRLSSFHFTFHCHLNLTWLTLLICVLTDSQSPSLAAVAGFQEAPTLPPRCGTCLKHPRISSLRSRRSAST
jgi:hypothetical protein